MSWNFSGSGTPAEVKALARTFKGDDLDLVNPEEALRHSMMDYIDKVMASCGGGATFPGTVTVTASGSQDPATNNPPNPKPTLSLSIG